MPALKPSRAWKACFWLSISCHLPCSLTAPQARRGIHVVSTRRCSGCQMGEVEGGSEAPRLFCCFTHLVSPCTTRHVYVGGGLNPASAQLVLPVRSSSPRLPTGVSQDPQHLGHWSWGARGGFAGNHQGFAARRGAQGHPPLLEAGTGVLPFHSSAQRAALDLLVRLPAGGRLSVSATFALAGFPEAFGSPTWMDPAFHSHLCPQSRCQVGCGPLICRSTP